MLFHPDKCKVMEITRPKKTKCSKIELSMETNNNKDRHILGETKVEKDLGVLITSNLKFDVQVKQCAAKASLVLGQLKRTFRYWTLNNFRTLYSAYVRPHLEYAAPVWSPYRKMDIKILEKVQRRATKLVPSLKNLSYQDRLSELKLTTLEERRKRGDLIQFFKIYTQSNIVTWQKALVTANHLTQSGPAAGLRRGNHSFCRPKTTQCSVREHFYTHRTIPLWNSLPASVIQSNSLNQFKNRLDNYLLKQSTIRSEITRLGSIQI